MNIYYCLKLVLHRCSAIAYIFCKSVFTVSLFWIQFPFQWISQILNHMVAQFRGSFGGHESILLSVIWLILHGKWDVRGNLWTQVLYLHCASSWQSQTDLRERQCFTSPPPPKMQAESSACCFLFWDSWREQLLSLKMHF